MRPGADAAVDTLACETLIAARSSPARPFCPSMRLIGSPRRDGLDQRMQDDEGGARGDEPRQQIPRRADQQVAAAIDGGRVAEQFHAGPRKHFPAKRMPFRRKKSSYATAQERNPPQRITPSRRAPRASPDWPSGGS